MSLGALERCEFLHFVMSAVKGHGACELLLEVTDICVFLYNENNCMTTKHFCDEIVNFMDSYDGDCDINEPLNLPEMVSTCLA